MLTFLRRIRKGLLEGGATSKYLLYAIGEIALVVIGILIALQINNWNEWRKDRDLEQNYLIELREDIISDSIEIQFVRSRIEQHTKSAELLLDLIDNQRINFDTSGLKKSLVNAGFLYFFHANLSTYNELVNSGKLNILSSKRLKELLDKYANWLVQLTAREEGSKETVWSEYTKYYQLNYAKDGRMVGEFRSTHASSSMNQYSIDWNTMKKDYEFWRLLTYVIETAKAQMSWAITSMENVTSIKVLLDELIKDELKTHP